MVRLRQALFQDENCGRDVAKSGGKLSPHVKSALSSGVPAREPLQVLQAHVSAASACTAACAVDRHACNGSAPRQSVATCNDSPGQQPAGGSRSGTL